MPACISGLMCHGKCSECIRLILNDDRRSTYIRAGGGDDAGVHQLIFSASALIACIIFSLTASCA